MMSHKICFYGEIKLIIPKLSLLPLLIWSTASCIFYTLVVIEVVRVLGREKGRVGF